MKNYYIEVNGCAIKDYQSFTSACKFFLEKSKDRNNVVNLYELKSHAFKDMSCSGDHYVLIESN